MPGRSRLWRVTVGLVALGLATGLCLAGCTNAAAPTPEYSDSGMPVHPTPSPSPLPPVPADSILGTWKLTAGSDATGRFDLDSTTTTLRIDGTDSGGGAPCNSYGANVSAGVAGPTTVTVGAHTERACAEAEKNSLEARYFAALDAVTMTRLSGRTLTLTGASISLTYESTASVS